MTKDEAQSIVLRYLESEWSDRVEIEVMPDQTIEKEYGWIFCYQSKKYIETQALKDMLIGNCPVLVRHSGEIVLFPTSLGIEESIRRYESGEPFFPKRNTR